MEAIGAVDECNAAIGSVLAAQLPEPLSGILRTVQGRLFIVGSELMAPDRTGGGSALPRLAEADVTELETAIDSLEQTLPELRNFILPGGSTVRQPRGRNNRHRMERSSQPLGAAHVRRAAGAVRRAPERSAAAGVLLALVPPSVPELIVMQPSQQVRVMIQPVRGPRHLVIVLAMVARGCFLLGPLAHDAQLFPA
jgi:hypothetical protein